MSKKKIDEEAAAVPLEDTVVQYGGEAVPLKMRQYRDQISRELNQMAYRVRHRKVHADTLEALVDGDDGVLVLRVTIDA